MFSLLYYLSILPYPTTIVKHYFHIFCDANFSISSSLAPHYPSMSFRGGAKPRRGNLPVGCLLLQYFLMDWSRRLPRRMAGFRHAPRNDSDNRWLSASIQRRVKHQFEFPEYFIRELATIYPTMVPGAPEKADRTSMGILCSRAITTHRSCSTCAPFSISFSIFS